MIGRRNSRDRWAAIAPSWLWRLIFLTRSSQELIEQQLAMRGFERLLRVQVGELQFQRRGCISGDARSSESAPMTTVLTLVVPPGNPTLFFSERFEQLRNRLGASDYAKGEGARLHP